MNAEIMPFAIQIQDTVPTAKERRELTQAPQQTSRHIRSRERTSRSVGRVIGSLINIL
jgi:hypothetical protein